MERFKFHIWHWWIDHPIILILVMCLGASGIHHYIRTEDPDFWDRGTVEVSATITSFGTMSSRRGWMTVMGVRLDDGSQRMVSVKRHSIASCKVGDRVVLQRKGTRIRPVNQDVCEAEPMNGSKSK